jgi:hypothetical protein
MEKTECRIPARARPGRRGNHGFDRAFDMRELSGAIPVVDALASLLVGLATILQIPQQIRHNARTGLEPLRRQRLDEVPQGYG